MRIVIDGRYLCDAYPGIGRYLYNLLGALPRALPEAELLVLVDPAGRNSRYDLGELSAVGLRLVPAALGPRSLRERLRLRGTLDALAPDLVHSPYYFAPPPRQAHVLTLHDAIPLRQRVPTTALARLLAQRALRSAARAAERVLVPSASVRDDARTLLGVPETRLRVTPYAVEARFQPASERELGAARQALGLPERYVLHVGTHKPHKNVARLLAAWRRADRRDHVLVLAGSHQRRSRDAAAVRWLGSVPEAQLPALYSGASLFVLPSLEEGFGLPLLEAMACGTPVACAQSPGLAEVAGEAAALFDPRDTDALTMLLGALLADAQRRADLAWRGLARARTFTWQRTAQLTAQAYRETLGTA
jgi:alpha-1,3-rhamnosyl/mannosyltransferase